jgi:hypothetical protein
MRGKTASRTAFEVRVWHMSAELDKALIDGRISICVQEPYRRVVSSRTLLGVSAKEASMKCPIAMGGDNRYKWQSIETLT